MARRDIVGGAVTARLNADIGATTTTVVLAASPGYSGWPTGINGEFYVVFDRGNAGEEQALALSRSGNTITFASSAKRGVNGTSAAAHLASVTIEHVGTAADLDEANAHINDTTLDQHTQYLKAATAAGAGLAITSRVLRLADMANATVKGRNTAGTGAPEDVTMAQLKTLLALASSNISDFTTAVQALIPTAGVVKSADESVSSATTGSTLQNDDELLLPLAANTEYAFEAFLYVITGGAPTFKLAFTVPTGYNALVWQPYHDDQTALTIKTTATQTFSGNSLTIPLASGTILIVRVSGVVRNGANAGNLTLQWAQAASNATTTTVKAGSWLRTQVCT